MVAKTCDLILTFFANWKMVYEFLVLVLRDLNQFYVVST